MICRDMECNGVCVRSFCVFGDPPLCRGVGGVQLGFIGGTPKTDTRGGYVESVGCCFQWYILQVAHVQIHIQYSTVRKKTKTPPAIVIYRRGIRGKGWTWG